MPSSINVANLAKKFASLLEEITDEKGSRVAFSLDAINGKSDEYTKLSDVIYSADVDTDSAYSWSLDYLAYLIDNVDPGQPIDADEYLSNSEELWSDAIDLYTSDLTAWLHAHPRNVAFISSALEMYSDPSDTSGESLIGIAQMIARRELAQEINQAITEKLNA
jgi:hypothetical protein